MSDELDRIKELVDEEHALRGQQSPDRERLKEVEIMLDQCWDLLRQRNARQEFGQDDNFTAARDETTVEGYLQ
jgi:hypothetical protein